VCRGQVILTPTRFAVDLRAKARLIANHHRGQARRDPRRKPQPLDRAKNRPPYRGNRTGGCPGRRRTGARGDWARADRRLTLRLARGSRMLPPNRRTIEVRRAGEKTTRSVVFEGKPTELKL
jgi:hypothetical protein